MILSVAFMRKIKGDCEDSSLLFSATLCLYIALTFALTSFLYCSPHLPTFFVPKCLLNKLTVLWRVISKAQWRSMPMLNLFCIHLLWRGLSPLPSWSYSLPSSSGLRAHTWSLLFVVGSMLASLYSPFAPPSLIFLFFSSLLFVKVVIIFQSAVIRILGSTGVQKHSRVTSGANSVHKSHSQGLSAFH